MATLTYLTLDDLERMAFDNRDQGVQVFAAQGPSGDEWHLWMKVAGVGRLFRAHRVENGAVVA